MKNYLVAVFVVVLYLVISTYDYHDEVQAERAYVSDVCSGLYPNYKNLDLKCEEK